MKNRYLLLLLPSTTSLALICEHPEIKKYKQIWEEIDFVFTGGRGWAGAGVCRSWVIISGNASFVFHLEFISGNALFLFHIEIISGKASFFRLLNIIKIAIFDKSFVTVYFTIFHYI